MEFLALVKEKAKLVEIDDDLLKRAGQRRLLRRREEAQRDLPDGGARPDARDPRRDRLRPRHRRAADRRRRRERAAHARARRCWSITHYQRLLNYIVPDFVHVLVDGRIVRSGGKELALRARGEGLRLARDGAARRGARRRTSAERCEAGAVGNELRAPRLLRRAPARSGARPQTLRTSAAFAPLRSARRSRRRKNEAWRYTGARGRVTGTLDVERRPPRARPRSLSPLPPAGVRARPPGAGAARRAEPPPRPGSPTRGQRLRGAEHARSSTTARRHRDRAAAPCVAEPIHIVLRRDRRRGRSASHPRVLVCWSPASARRPRSSRRYGGAGAAHFTNAVTEIVARRRAPCSSTTKLQSESDARLPHRTPWPCARAATQPLHVRTTSRSAPRSRATTSRRLDGRGRRVRPQRPLSSAGGDAAPRQPHRHRPRAARTAPAASSTRAMLDGHARGVFHGQIIVRQDAQKTDARQTNRTCCCPRRARQHQAAARDLRRRREVHARRDHRAARRRGALLPALARHRRGRGAAPADVRVRRRRRRAASRSRRARTARRALASARCLGGARRRPR